MNDNNSNNMGKSIMCFLMGLGGQLFITIPGLGTLPFLDVFAYAFSIPILIFSWNKMGHHVRQTIIWGFIWTIAAIIANLANFLDTWYFWKSVAIVSSSWAIMIVAFDALRSNGKLFLSYLIGVGLGSAIGLHYFTNGAYLAVMRGGGIENLLEKQIYPAYAKGIIFSVVLPLTIGMRDLPAILTTFVALAAGFFMLLRGGSRSNFGIALAAAMMSFLVNYMKALAHFVFRHAMLFGIGVVIAAAVVFSLYEDMAESGALGEGEALKYEREAEFVQDTGKGRLTTRGGFDETWEVVKEKPWGMGGTMIRHSVISNSFNCEGWLGLFFWVYFFWLIFWFFTHRIEYSGKYSIFLTFQVLTACWAVIGSPFGSRHTFFVLMIFIALCRDNPYYGYGTLFDRQMPIWRKDFK